MPALNALRVQFGREKDRSLESSVRTIYQSLGGQDMYPNVASTTATARAALPTTRW
ncbi:hypothetical protein J4D99_18185 [Siccationidurans ginsengisoli]|uniref:hypothetical protein n=1 Tax=Hymenobacter TaxID=89966 RepID=UPI001AC15434|nr:hypothetical protein [Hymenobacter sp. KCTC 23674]MBO2033332.1 hypothetical protein [Hymenobacter sp. BT559]